MEDFKLGRLPINEHHGDENFPAEILSITIGELLDKLGAVDTEGNAEYEIIEAVIKAVAPTILADAAPLELPAETETSAEEDDFAANAEAPVEVEGMEEIPSFLDTMDPAQVDGHSVDQEDELDFKF